MDPRNRIFRQTVDPGGSGGSLDSLGGPDTGGGLGGLQIGGLPSNVWGWAKNAKQGESIQVREGTYVADGKGGATLKPSAATEAVTNKNNAIAVKDRYLPTRNSLTGESGFFDTQTGQVTMTNDSPEALKAKLDQLNAQTKLQGAEAAAAPINASANATNAAANAGRVAIEGAQSPSVINKNETEADKNKADEAAKLIKNHQDLYGEVNTKFEQAYYGIQNNPNLSDQEKAQAVADAKKQLLQSFKDGLDANQRAIAATTAFRDTSTAANTHNAQVNTAGTGIFDTVLKSGFRNGPAAAGFLKAMAQAAGTASADMPTVTPYLTGLMNGNASPGDGTAAPAPSMSGVGTGAPNPNAVAPNGLYGNGNPGNSVPPQVQAAVKQAAAAQLSLKHGIPPAQAQAIVEQHFSGTVGGLGASSYPDVNNPTDNPYVAAMPSASAYTESQFSPG